MTRDRQGNYSPPLSNWNPAVDGNEADADDWNQLLQDLSTALSQSLSSDGQTSMTGTLRMGGNRIQDLGEPTGNNHAIRRSQLSKGGNLGSANNVKIPNEGALFDVTGTTDIKSLSGGFNGRLVVLRFLDSLTIEHSDNLALPNQSNIVTNAGDAFVFYRFSGDKWAALYGASATRDVVSSNTDTSGGDKVITQGWMGLGGRAPTILDLNDNTIPSGFYHADDASGRPTGVEYFGVFVLNRGSRPMQFGYDYGSNKYYVRTRGPSSWDDWEELYHTGNFPPIGFCYIQYPGTAAPSSLFGGTWTLMFNSEGVFFRTEGQGASSFGGGVQRDALQQHGHVLQTGRNDSTQYHNTGSSRGHVGAGFEQNYNAGDGWVRNVSSAGSYSARTASETRPRNRTVRVWRKTAH